jgi:sugar/nucleoside kinase (ribokinase family)
MSLLTVGTVAFDDIKTPHGHAEKAIGGAATYISLAASYFVRPVNIVSIIGDDFPQEVLRDLESRGVDTTGIQKIDNEKSFYWAGEYSQNLNDRETLKTELNVLEDFKPTLPDNYKASEYVMLGNLTPDIQMKVIEQVDNPKLVAMDTMNFWMDIAWDGLMKVIPKVDVLIINDEEARQLSGEYALAMAADKILDMGIQYLIIKKGEHGALFFQEDREVFFAPALPLSVVKDPTGAGDTFAGGFMGYMAQTGDLSFENMKRAVIYGSAMASFCVEEFSIEKLSDLSKKDIDDRVQQFVDLVHFEAK